MTELIIKTGSPGNCHECVYLEALRDGSMRYTCNKMHINPNEGEMRTAFLKRLQKEAFRMESKGCCRMAHDD